MNGGLQEPAHCIGVITYMDVKYIYYANSYFNIHTTFVGVYIQVTIMFSIFFAAIFSHKHILEG